MGKGKDGNARECAGRDGEGIGWARNIEDGGDASIR